MYSISSKFSNIYSQNCGFFGVNVSKLTPNGVNFTPHLLSVCVCVYGASISRLHRYKNKNTTLGRKRKKAREKKM